MLVFHILFYMLKFVNLSYESPEVDLKIELNKNGFHREIKYSVKFGKNYQDHECDYLLKQSIPASAYVMVDQLANLRMPRKIEITYPLFLNTEALSDNSESFNIFIKIHSKLPSVEISLPVHYRYHRSKNKNSTYAAISKPLVYSACYTDRSLWSNSIQTLKNKQNIQSATNCKLFYGNCSFVKARITDECNWILLKAEYNKNFITAEIPVGIHDGYLYISTITISFSWIIVIYILFKIYFVLENKI